MCATDRADGIFLKIQCSECKIKVGFLVETEKQSKFFFSPLFFIAKSEDLCIIILFLYI